METASRAGAETTSLKTAGPPGEHRVDGYLMAGFPWYGLDETYPGPRWLMRVGATSDGTVEHGSVGHGDKPSKDLKASDSRRFVVVVTVCQRAGRNAADGTGTLEATSVSTAAWLAGVGLLASTWPIRMDRSLRQAWVDQQTAAAWELADDLEGPGWSRLTLPVNGTPTPFHYRESAYGWVLAGQAADAHLGAYGRGISAYSLGFSVIADIASYHH
ncbi:hypothetical protein AQ490_10015 [Wenjunlia vitaminophila]|uniref:Uncharacterized protein n=1 Tax=Wenjunlia vitaminophila TaxID=76728 RepID=A0A0T6LLT8_WENVI|nr:hypothetical protein [Wenjunlia vitaminophila]KRV47079.1 hypothetical protein AQ490_10015 [Wenjunlia vitaminophila]